MSWIISISTASRNRIPRTYTKKSSLNPNSGTEELDNIYSVALLMEDMSIQIEIFVMVNMFSILKFVDNGTPENLPTKISWSITKRLDYPM